MKRMLMAATLFVAGLVGVAGASPVALAEVNPCDCQPEWYDWEQGFEKVPPSAVATALDQSEENISLPWCEGEYPYDQTQVELLSQVQENPCEVTPVKPNSTPPTCEGPGTVQELASTDQYSYSYSPNTPAGSTTVTVTAKGYFVLVGDKGPWTFPITQLSGEVDCPVASNPPPETPPVAVPPAAVVPPAAPTERPPVVEETAVAAAGPVPAQATPVAAPAQPAPTALPATGTSSWVLAFIAMALVLVGSGFVSFSRRFS